MKIRRELFLPAALLVLGLFLMGLGIGQGELVTLLKKAIVICLECIGIG